MDVGVESARLTKRLSQTIERCDVEIGTYDRDASATEIERLGARLAALEGDAAADSLPHQELIALVRRELDLVRQMRAGCEVVTQRRARLFTLMRGLWTQLVAIGDPAAEESGVMATSIDRVRSLCVEIAADLTHDQDPASSRLSQARAVAHSRLTVAGETPSASAVSSMLKPPK